MLVSLLVKWLWLPAIAVFGALLVYLKGVKDTKTKEKVEELQEDLETMKRIQNVKVNDNLDAAVDRLRSSGKLRDD